MNAIKCDNFIDPHFLSFMEYKVPDKLKFVRIDADVDEALKNGESTEDTVLGDIFKNAINDAKVTVKFESLKNSELPAVIVVDEYMRRYSEMGQIYGMSDGVFPTTMIVNMNCPIIANVKTLDEEKQSFVAKYIYLQALASYKKLTQDESDEFNKANFKLLSYYMN